ncbi:TPA: ABC transporter substrate-binding protein [Campylobacter jejuni]|nr:ABC transporter substrate-binding protein [Campylobacter jejuni]HED7180044.1 ABC transporter substrate-binding protein [Campylobacter jejuni]HED7693165.1 ABC transporter substrate-binding protein [Campylobacter jejuni]HED9018287.1 ABC transporter substrate-binding protein [Campylobacter jejuni]HEF4177507.1 ABC transporter substrate-binding protein [Campylobacter jejuni]
MFKKYLKLFFIILGIFGANLTLAKEIVVKDVLDREVKLNLPAKRIALGFYYTDFLAVGGVKSLDNVVGFSKAVWTDWTPASWELDSKTLPQLNSIADFGEVEVGTFSVEKVLSLKPDLLILAAWQYEVIREDLAIFEKHNIPVVVIDYNQESVAKHSLSTEILGQEEKALELVDFYKSRISVIQERIKSASLPKPKIYIEFGNKGPQENSFTFGNDMWGALIELAGGENIAKNLVKKWGVINPELVLKANPDVIIITDRESDLEKNKEAMVMGFNIEENEALKRLERFKFRKGYENLNAIIHNKLFGAYHRASTTLADVAMVEFIAKTLYPSLFKDIDPLKTYLDFHQKFLLAKPQGTFMIKAKNAK